jgi:hypothetical protein
MGVDSAASVRGKAIKLLSNIFMAAEPMTRLTVF